MEESGHPQVCLNSSRSLGLRHVLAGHPCSHRDSLAHSRSQIDVVEVREQVGGQGDSALRYVVVWGGWYCPIVHWWVVLPVFYGWSKVWVVE